MWLCHRGGSPEGLEGTGVRVGWGREGGPGAAPAPPHLAPPLPLPGSVKPLPQSLPLSSEVKQTYRFQQEKSPV